MCDYTVYNGHMCWETAYNKVLKVCITFLDNERWGSDAVHANTISLAATAKILS